MLAFVFFLAGSLPPAAALAAEPEPLPAAIAKMTPSVVAIIGKPVSSAKTVDNNRFNLAHGTGVIVRTDGYIITNAHVVKDMRNIVVVTSEGVSYPGKTTHYDEESDLALVKIEATGLPAAAFAASGDVHVGQTVMAIGTPLSFALRNSVSAGIVSGIDRAVHSRYQLIQTDAAINPGNSGGALINMQGQVVGINTLKYVSLGVDSLGFAIPVDTVQYVMGQFFKYGKVKRPYLGLELEESWEAVVGLPTKEGLKVSYVEPDSPAALAGVKKGDVLLSIEGKAINSLVAYYEVLKKYIPGDRISLRLQGASGAAVLDITVAEDPASASAKGPDQDNAGIDSDQGKTRIGDSHYGWSMDYPSGLIKAKQSPTGDSIGFGDSKGEFGVFIDVSEKQSEDLSAYGLLQKLASRTSNTVLDKQYVDRPEFPYARLTGKTSGGAYFQMRAFLKQDRIYYITLYVDKEENYQNSFKQNSYNDLLDTFGPRFDEQDSSLKDVSVYQNKNTVSTEYGITYDVPGDWKEDSHGSVISHSNKEGTESIALRVTSASSGDTLKDWAGRQEQKLLRLYEPDYRTASGLKETTVGGVTAYEDVLGSTMGDKWNMRHVFYLIKDKFKYRLEFAFPKETDEQHIESLILDTVKSVKFDKESLNKTVGFIQDDDDLADPSKTYTYTNATYKYSVQVPEIWSTTDYERDTSVDSKYKTFSFIGGSFTIEADDRTPLDDVVKRVSQNYKKSADNDADYQYTESDSEAFGGEVKLYELAYKTKASPYTQKEYIFHRGSITYTVRVRINDAVKTVDHANRIEACLASLKITAGTK
ncbi:serine protease [Paenibacillus thalictri]|uniref:Serine protease n=2 Tax=Paenibacillus thalictri TaxID=2527873 RepID=A0A4Q9DM93_9BACL|nr:serine protease [Paenibacillus thalictri]